MAKSMDDTQGGSQDIKWHTEITWEELKGKHSYIYRLVGSVFVFGRHWVPVDFSDIANPNTKKYARECVNFSEKDEAPTLDNGCPFCKLAKTNPALACKANYCLVGINRELQADSNKKFVRAMKILPITAFKKITALRNDNKIKNKKTGETELRHVTDPKYGRDIKCKYDENAAGADKYSFYINPDSDNVPKPLTEEEQAAVDAFTKPEDKFPNFSDKSIVEAYNRDSMRSLVRQKVFDEQGNIILGASSEESDMPKASSKKKKMTEESSAPPAKKKAQVKEESSEEAPVKTKKKSVEESDEAPVVKKKAAVAESAEDSDAPPVKVKKKVVEESSEAPPPPKKAKPPVVEESSSAAEDSDEPVKVKKKTVVEESSEEAPAPKKSKKPVVEESSLGA